MEDIAGVVGSCFELLSVLKLKVLPLHPYTKPNTLKFEDYLDF